MIGRVIVAIVVTVLVFVIAVLFTPLDDPAGGRDIDPGSSSILSELARRRARPVAQGDPGPPLELDYEVLLAQVKLKEAERIAAEQEYERALAAALYAEELARARTRAPVPRVSGGDPVGSGTNDHLARIRQCESGGNYGAVSPGGTYRGAYQFLPSTWAAVGGTGDPAAASPEEQDLRASILYEQAGPGQWPVCQYR